MSRLICMIFVADLIVSRLIFLMTRSAVICRPVSSRLWSGFLVWLLFMILLLLPSGMVWRVCGVRVSEACISSLCCSRAFSACWVGKASTPLISDQLYITFIWLCVSWFHSQGVWAAPYTRLLWVALLASLADLVWYVFVGFCLGRGCWVVLNTKRLACWVSAAVVHWDFKVKARLESVLSVSLLKGVWCLVVPFMMGWLQPDSTW
jgi:hypothetical protein